MGLAGKYEYESNENVKDLLLAIVNKLGKDASKVEEYDALLSENKSKLEIIPDGDKFTLISTHLGKEFPLTFEVGKEFDDAFPGSPKSTASLNGDNLVITFSFGGKPFGKREYAPTTDGLIITLHSEISGKEAKIVYKRL